MALREQSIQEPIYQDFGRGSELGGQDLEMPQEEVKGALASFEREDI